jgi:hypothetical protein
VEPLLVINQKGKNAWFSGGIVAALLIVCFSAFFVALFLSGAVWIAAGELDAGTLSAAIRLIEIGAFSLVLGIIMDVITAKVDTIKGKIVKP